MSFNSYNRFRGAIVNSLVDYSIISNRKINNVEDLREVLKIQSKTNSGFTLKDIEKIATYGITNIDTKEIKFENELTFVESKISFLDDKLLPCHMHQIFVIENNSEKPIVNMTMLKNIPYNFFKNISREVVVLDIGNCYTTSYETYTENKKIIKEEYIRNYHYEGTDIDDISLLDALRATSKRLEFSYFNGELIERDIDVRITKNFVDNEINDKVKEIHKILDNKARSHNKKVKKHCNDNKIVI